MVYTPDCQFKGHSYLTFESYEGVQKALLLSGFPFNGRFLKVYMSKKKCHFYEGNNSDSSGNESTTANSGFIPSMMNPNHWSPELNPFQNEL